MMIGQLDRRKFLASCSVVGGSLVLGLTVQAQPGEQGGGPPTGKGPPETPVRNFRLFAQFGADGTITLTSPQTEMGQGVFTTLPMMLADELDIDFAAAKIETAQNDAQLSGWRGKQATVASQSVRFWYPEFRRIGALGRGLFIAAAARLWGVDPARLDTKAGQVVDPASGRSASYASLVAITAKMDAAEVAPRPIPTERYRYIEKNVPRRDTRAKITGEAVFGADVRFPGMAFAAVAMSPYFETSSARFDAEKIRAMPGVIDVRELDDAVIVSAESWWQAKRAIDMHPPTFVPTDAALFDDSDLLDMVRNGHKDQEAKEVGKEGDVERAFSDGAVVETEFDFPFLAHACMEPLAGTARLDDMGVVEVFAPTQSQEICAMQVAGATRRPPEKVRVIPTFIGGGFGRKISDNRAAVQAAQLAVALKRPVQVQWSREDDIRRDRYRPAVNIKMKGSTAKDDMISGLQIAVSGPSLSVAAGMPLRDGVDIHAVAALAETPYATPNFKLTAHMIETPVPLAFWRAVGDSHNPFAREVFVDMLAEKAEVDPAEFRKRALKKGDARMARLLDQMIADSEWSHGAGTREKSGTARRGMGMAIEEALGSYIGQVAWVRVEETGAIVVERILAVVDCGRAISSNTITAQIEGGIIFAQTAAQHGQIRFENGRVREQNFNDYKMVRMADAPQIDVVIIPSQDDPGGVGELGVPPTAPAIANAVFAACGVRMKSMPFTPFADELAEAVRKARD